MTHQSALGLNRGLTPNFLWLKRANRVKFIEECVICTEKHTLVKIVYKWACRNELKSKRLPMKWKHTDSLVRQNSRHGSEEG